MITKRLINTHNQLPIRKNNNHNLKGNTAYQNTKATDNNRNNYMQKVTMDEL